jgi:hypothetical protein
MLWSLAAHKDKQRNDEALLEVRGCRPLFPATRHQKFFAELFSPPDFNSLVAVQ